ncbi:hypothetical protein PG993_001109 [Apiospora rasikravindrae]|uniref:TM7S3/TM198-like domain-containing protein n=1 Tax=Apiospora rasikravindrae TaxID=990691 RepID=A0ABR1UAZ5_9PEZI
MSNTAAVQALGPVRRQDTTAVATTGPPGGETPTSTATPTDTETAKTTAISTTRTSGAPSTTVVPSPTAAPSALNGNNTPTNTTVSNGKPANRVQNACDEYSDNCPTATVPPGELPLTPVVTPGWGVAGAILIATGVVYTLIGIKNTWLNAFGSTAYLSSLCTTVLILYVMVLPVTNAIQGAYVVAVVCTGLLLGGGAVVFRDLTESLGCLLGGFCFSMWLLSLHDGGLLQDNTSGKVVFIIVFTLAGFALYFSQYTRAYGLMAMMSFTGATVIVLGIDCFSRAGLKEFWAWIWDLNSSLFPLGATTYPITRGMRVELALTVLFCGIGIISQLRLWKVIQERRAKRAEDHAAARRQMDEEEATLGRQVEAENARERREWEATYGQRKVTSPSISQDSGVGDVGEKPGRIDDSINKEIPGETVIELTELPESSPAPPPKPAAGELVTSDPKEESSVTIRVAQDETPANDDSLPAMPEPAQLDSDKEANESARPVSQISVVTENAPAKSAAPEVIPLPFQIPEHADRDSDDEDDRSSFATFADEDRSVTFSKRDSRGSLGNRLSVESGHLFRRLSHRSIKSSLSKRRSGALSPSPLSPTGAESQEDLVTASRDAGEDGSGSVVATVDGMSVESEKVEDDGDDDRMTVKGSSQLPSIEISHGLPDTPATIARKHALRKVDSTKKSMRPESAAETVATDILNPSIMDETVGVRTARNSAAKTTAGTDKPKDISAESQDAMATPKRVASASPSTDSTPNSLTKDRLPSSLSRVAKSYRTNEWAKHLALADAPEPEELKVDVPPNPVEAKVDEETAAPVDVEGLQQTAVTAALPPAVMPMPSASSEPAPMSRSNSRVSVNSVMTTAQDPGLRPSHSFKRSSFNQANRVSSADVVMRQPIPEEETGGELHASPQSASPVGSARVSPVSSRRVSMEQTGEARPPVPGVVSYSSPQTLLGMREVLLRGRSQVEIVPEVAGYPAQATSDAGSVRQSQSPVQDADDLPLSQRKQLMRQQSLQYAASPIETKHNSMQPTVRGPTRLSSAPADAVPFDSHQPQRYSTLPSQAAREAKMQNFRQSVAQDLRAGTPIIPSGTNGSQTLLASASQNPLVLGAGTLNRDGAARQSIDQGRFKLLSQKEQEAQRKQMALWEKERTDRLFEERMRRGDLMDAHRDALRRMQSAVRDS